MKSLYLLLGVYAMTIQWVVICSQYNHKK